MHLLMACLLIWAWATASTSAALLVVVTVQRAARALDGRKPTSPFQGRRGAQPLSTPYPGPATTAGRELARA